MKAEDYRMERSNEIKYVLINFLAICLLATGGILVKESYLPPVATGFYRVIFAIPLLLPIVYKNLKGVGKRDVLLILIAGASLGIDLILWNTCFFYTTVANGTLFTNLVSLTMIPASYFIFKEKIPPKFFIGVFVTLLGAVVLLNGKVNPTADSFFGDFLSFSASFFYAGFLLIVYRIRDRVDAFTIMFISSFGTAITMFIAMLVMEGCLYPATVRALLPILGLTIFSQILGQGLISYCLGKIRAILASVVMLMQPLVAAIYAFAIIGEKLSMVEVTGIVVTLTGIYIAKKTI